MAQSRPGITQAVCCCPSEPAGSDHSAAVGGDCATVKRGICGDRIRSWAFVGQPMPQMPWLWALGVSMPIQRRSARTTRRTTWTRWTRRTQCWTRRRSADIWCSGSIGARNIWGCAATNPQCFPQGPMAVTQETSLALSWPARTAAGAVERSEAS